jgi:hypothetical protein
MRYEQNRSRSRALRERDLKLLRGARREAAKEAGVLRRQHAWRSVNAKREQSRSACRQVLDEDLSSWPDNEGWLPDEEGEWR